MERATMVATGVPQLDTILGGGIVERSVLLICGPPGSGKTVLASQIMSSAVDRGEPVLLVTAFSEPQAKLLAHLRGFSFFRSAAVGDTIKLLNLQHQLQAGIDAAADTLVREAREQGATMVVLDELGGILLSSADAQTTSEFLYTLSAKLGLLGIIMIMTLDLAPGAELERPELAAADTVMALAQEHAAGTQRTLRVVKHRGAAALPGYHHFRIDEHGVQCYARLEALARPDDGGVAQERVAFGIDTLDAAMNGGPNAGSVTLLHGPASAVRPLGLRWLLHGLERDEPACLVSLREPAHRSLRGTQAQLWQQAAREGRLLLSSYHPAELLPDRLAHELLEGLRGRDGWRVAIDGAGLVAPVLDAQQRGWQFWSALLAELRAHGATVLLLDYGRHAAAGIANTSLPDEVGLDTLPDNVLRVYRRLATTYCSVLEMRSGPFDEQPVALDRLKVEG